MYETRGEIENVDEPDEMLKDQDSERRPPATVLSSTFAPSDVTVCVARSAYYGLVTGIFFLILVAVIVTVIAGVCYKRVRRLEGKSGLIDLTHPMSLPGISYALPKLGTFSRTSALVCKRGIL